MGINRRNFIKATGAAALTGLAGCAGDNDDSSNQTQTDNTTPPDEETPQQDQETQIEFLESHDINTVPIVRDSNIDDTAGLRLEVEDQDGLENVKLNYNDAHRDQPLTLYDKARGEFEEGVDGNMVPIQEEFPQRIIAPETGSFTVEATDVNGNTQTRTEPINGLNGGYRADRKRIANSDAETGNIGNYSTERNWDDLVTNTQELRETQERVLEEQAYTPLVNEIMSGNFESGGNVYPNYGNGNNRGFFDQEAVKNEDDFETLIRWYLPAIMDHDGENYGAAPSGRNDRFATTLETLLNEHHPSAEATSTSVKAFPAHGIFGVQDQDNEEFYLVDTTSSSAQFDQAVGRIGEFITSEDGNRSELWDPFHDFEPGAQEGLHYEGKSTSAMGALGNFVLKGHRFGMQEGDLEGTIFMTDEWMNDAYQVLRNGGSIQSIVEPIEEVIYKTKKAETDENVGIYGNLDDTRIAVTSDEEIYEAVNYDETQTPGIEEIETMLEAA